MARILPVALSLPSMRSLKGRLLLFSLVLLPLLLGLSGVVLDQAFSRSLLASQTERMKAQLYLVLGAVDFDGMQLQMPDNLTEPRYSQLDSGLFALIARPEGEVLWRSPSAIALSWNSSLSGQELGPGESHFQSVRLSDRALFLYQLAVIWEHLGGRETPLVISVLEDQGPMRAEIHSYRIYLWLALGAIVAAWFALLWILVRWGLRPLDQLAQDLDGIERGEREQLEGYYATEVQQLTRRLNQLIRAERQQRERYRNTLADLAHSLKTPLAVLRGHLSHADRTSIATDQPELRPEQGDSERLHQEMQEQVARMDQIIAYQLQRAVMAADQRLLKPLSLKPLLQRLLDTLQKVYRSKAMHVELCGEDSLSVLGDERDFLELFGNLLDNAFKYGRHHVKVSLSADQGAQRLQVVIEDDGPGIAPEAWSLVRQRGVRADQMQPGQGIGLAVASDILASYQGDIRLARSGWGGAAVQLQLALA